MTRAICHSVPGLQVEPQVVISTPHVWARPDLVDRHIEIVVECESYEWHGDRAGFRKDVRRYTLLTAQGPVPARLPGFDADPTRTRKQGPPADR